jgi:hypothetical protein
MGRGVSGVTHSGGAGNKVAPFEFALCWCGECGALQKPSLVQRLDLFLNLSDSGKPVRSDVSVRYADNF